MAWDELSARTVNVLPRRVGQQGPTRIALPARTTQKKGGQETMNNDQFDQLINTLPPYMRGPNARRVIRNLANGGARLRMFMQHKSYGVGPMHQLAVIADMFGSQTRTLRPRTNLHLLAR